MNTIITILDTTTETSMPFNEFVIWRANHYHDQRQVLIICSKKGVLPQIVIPSNVEIIRCSKTISSIRRALRTAVKSCNERSEHYVIHLHHVDSGMWAQIAMIGTGYRKKTLFTAHSTFSGYAFHNKVRSYFNGLCANFISVVSKSAYMCYPKSLKRLKNSRIMAIQNGVDTERIDKMMSKQQKKMSEKVIFVYVARMVPIKNHHFLLDVLHHTDERVCFEFIGSIAPDIKKRVEEEGLSERVIMTGLIPRDEVFLKLQEAHYYISSSILEGLPISLLEGMYSGLPAVVSNIPQHAEVASDSRLVKLLDLDVETWRMNVNHLASIQEELISEWGRKSREYVRNNFSLERMHRQYDEIYERIFQIKI